jgi:MFS transporter, LPLT family, lysophospholipid transporter
LIKGFYFLIAAQFVSGLADNALLIITIARLDELSAPAWWTPLLKLFFTLSYVVLAPFVGPFADSLQKGRVMLLMNSIKAVGCGIILVGLDPLLAFMVVGLGAAGYSPAKYGLITELLPADRLVAANGWIEVSTVCSIILGTVLGGVLVGMVDAATFAWLPSHTLFADTDLVAALLCVLVLYAAAAVLNAYIPDSGARYAAATASPMALIKQFWQDNTALWGDSLGRTSLAVTTLFWGTGATLQFVVLRWGTEALELSLEQAAYLQGITAVGITVGALMAARFVPLGTALSVLPLGVGMGLLVPLITLSGTVGTTLPLLVAVGVSAGFFVVPMNALLQHRGHALLSAGRSIAIQNFNENLCVLLMLALYAALVAWDVPLNWLIWGFGLLVATGMGGIVRTHHYAQRRAAIPSTTYPIHFKEKP